MINRLKAFVALGLIGMFGGSPAFGEQAGMTLPTGTSHAEESSIPREMVYVGHGPSVMGLDK